MASGGPGGRASQMQKRMEDRQEAEASINMEAQMIALKRKAASWGANEDEESITGFSGRWEALSNWFPATVVWSGKQYPSVEHAFQAAKAEAEPEQAEAIRKAASPKEANALGQALSLPPTWERQRLTLMETLLRDKFRRDSALRERLLRTENKNLIANNKWGEAFWGVSGGNGGNNLGKLLMSLRDEARAGDDVDAWLRSSFEVAAVGPDLDPISLEQTRKGEPIKPDLTLGAAALYFVGKHSACAVQLDHPSLSRRHAVLLRDKARGLLVVDLASKAPSSMCIAPPSWEQPQLAAPACWGWAGWLWVVLHTPGKSGHAAQGPVRGWGTDSRLGPETRMLRPLPHQAGTTLNKKRLPPSTGIPLKDGDVLVFGGSSRTHTLRIHQRDALQLLEEQHAALTAQLAALEKEVADPATQHAQSCPGLGAAHVASRRSRGPRACSGLPSGPGRRALAA